MIMNRTLFQVAKLNSVCLRPFSSLNMGAITKDQVINSADSKWVGQLCRQICESESAQHADAVDEYFRKNFRSQDFRTEDIFSFALVQILSVDLSIGI